MINKSLFLKSILTILVLSGYSSFSYSQTDGKQEEIFVIVEQMPEYPGGTDARNKFISDMLNYPQQAIEDGVQGRVYINFIVEKNGSISNIKVLRGIGSGCDEEAVRVVSLFPKWKPGKQRGKKVRVSSNLPFVFKLKTIDNSKIFYTADTMPGFYGGVNALNDFIKNNLRYPTTIFDDKIIDTIQVLFVVEKDGSVNNTTLREHKDTLNAYELEAIRIVKDLPKFEPAYSKGKAIRLILLQKVVFDYTKADTSYMEIISENYLGNEYTYYYDDIRFTIVESMPEFPGGTRALYRYLGENIKYPPSAKNKGLQGRIFVNFVIEKDGSVSNARVLKGVSPELNNEALRVVNNMPKWKPGMQKGEPMCVSYNLPIKFTLDNSTKKKYIRRKK